VVVIAHPGVPVNSIDTKSLSDIYVLTQTAWNDNTPIRVFALKKGFSSTEKFYSHLGLNVLTLNKQWLRIQLTGEGRAPSLVNEDEIVQKVAATPGAIGFVDISHVTERVKVLGQIAP
jgi:ABC-type phosphate transport system substrate-binding protein